ncbi:MAG TPA: SDR family NAD(P)-dependent oxidoreductase [Bdellovibrionota bacterium]|nr:SDR family NAD(P)-dependent oxidoreductase [Bdellovibrionota bacterium]
MDLKKRLEGKSVLITGASSGIGAALAREFAKAGAKVALAARRLDRLETLNRELTSSGCSSLVLECDVTSEGDLESAARRTRESFGKIDIVVANAGYGVVGNVEAISLTDFRNQFETNVFGLLRTFYATCDELKKSRGTFVLLGSVASYISLPGAAPYSMSKFAVRALARALREELKPHDVSVVLISPGFVESDIRRVDNRGKLHLESEDPLPHWIKMPATTAAQKILTAIARKRPEEIITFHGKIAVWIERHFPKLVSYLVGRGAKGRPEPGRD